MNMSYLSPPSRVTKIKLPSTLTSIKRDKSTKKLTISIIDIFLPKHHTKHSRSSLSNKSSSISPKKHPTWTILTNYYFALATQATSSSAKSSKRSNYIPTGMKIRWSLPCIKMAEKYCSMDMSILMAEIMITVLLSMSRSTKSISRSIHLKTISMLSMLCFNL